MIGRTAFGGSHMISVRNADGSLAWEHRDDYAVGQGMGEVVTMPDSGLVHVGVADHCDVFGDCRVRRYAPDGTMLWERIISPQISSGFTLAAKGSINHVAVASSDSVHILDMDGNTEGAFELPPWSLRKILWASDSSLFMVQGMNLERVDLAGGVLASTGIGPSVADMHWDGQRLFVMANDSVRTFNTNLEVQGVSALPGMDANSGFAVSENNLYGHTPMGLYQVDSDGIPTLLYSWPALPNWTSTGAAVRNGTVLSVGNTDISGRSTGITRTLSMNGDVAQHDQDVEVLLHVDSAWAEYVGTPNYPWNRKADLTGLIVNHGPDTLRSVVLSMWISIPYLFCEMPTNRIDTVGLALVPGDTLQFPFGVVDVALALTQAQAASVTGELCIVALAPDRLADRAPDDNTACESVDFTLAVEGLEGIAPLALFPNPASRACTVTGLAALGGQVHLRVLDGTGRAVLVRGVVRPGDRAELDTSGLPPGSYILEAAGSRARATARLMVVRP